LVGTSYEVVEDDYRNEGYMMYILIGNSDFCANLTDLRILQRLLVKGKNS